MANTLKFGNGEWYGKKDTILAYNDENYNYKPLPFKFERDSSATVVNKDGLIETVGSGQPRIDYKDDSKGALLLEPSRTNLVTYSEDATNWNTQSSSVLATSNQAISPDGTLNADKLIPASGSVVSNGGRYISFSSTAGTDYSVSVFVKQGEYRYVTLSYGSNAAYGFHFDLQDGIIIQEFDNTNNYTSISREVKSFGNGWYRLSISLTDILSVVGRFISVRPANELPTATNNNYATTGDGTSGIYAWGLQVEEASYATSYIPTQGSTVTRLADKTIANLPSSAIGQSEGVLYFEGSYFDTSEQGYVELSDGGNANRIIVWNVSASSLRAFIEVGDTTQAQISGGSISSNTIFKFAFKYKPNDFALWVNGIKVGTDTNGSTFGNNVLNQLDLQISNVEFKGEVKELKLYNTALTDAELIALTS